MFEQARFLGPTESSIVVQTRAGTDIPNLVEVKPGYREIQLYGLLLKRFGANWIERKPASGVYNCAGHVWASRRTAILETKHWNTILRDDGYRKLAETEQPRVGDLVLYIDNVHGDYLHVGQVVELREGVSPTSPHVPWVLSKWNSTSGETLHSAYDAPYEQMRQEYWTDRPIE
ncbi:MAG: hypothetical protein JW888_12735 [Pirellulales bacterium]|nr:hypothetical protein [Pirellulales bacterium]